MTKIISSNFAKVYLVALAVFLFLDMIWLGLVAKSFYADQLGYLMKADINWAAAIIFYLLFIAGLVVFVIQPAIEKSSLKFALTMGLFFGLVTYATYDLTNLATVKSWPLSVTLIDMAWGSILAASVSFITFRITRKFFEKA